MLEHVFWATQVDPGSSGLFLNSGFLATDPHSGKLGQQQIYATVPIPALRTQARGDISLCFYKFGNLGTH